jgi:hypothetical protein
MNEIQGKHSVPPVLIPLGSIIIAATTKEEEEQQPISVDQMAAGQVTHGCDTKLHVQFCFMSRFIVLFSQDTILRGLSSTPIQNMVLCHKIPATAR